MQRQLPSAVFTKGRTICAFAVGLILDIMFTAAEGEWTTWHMRKIRR